MQSMISIKSLHKVYAGGFKALNDVNLEIKRGEVFALLGPNGAGKTTLINIVCGIANATAGSVKVGGHDISSEYRQTRSIIGLVPQELPTESFETIWSACRFSRGLFDKPRNPAHIEKVLRSLSLWDKKDTISMQLSGGMKRRSLIAKALAHEPEVLFLDEPTAGVDVELRQDMWSLIAGLREEGVTIILTTHYIEEAEQLADRVGVINNGEIIIVAEKDRLMRDMGKKYLTLNLQQPLAEIPTKLSAYQLELSDDKKDLIYSYDTKREGTGITALLGDLNGAGIHFKDLQTSQSSLEDIFVDLVHKNS
jgi:ABC-2 type transport system ATP-binding protein